MSHSIPTIEKIVLDKGDTGLGFNIRGGLDNNHVYGDPGIFITTVKPNGAAAKDGRLQPGDKILEIDGENLREVSHQVAVKNFHKAGSVVTLLVERGAEQRILAQAMKDNVEMNSLVPDRAKRNPRRSQGFFRWQWLPLSLIIGGSTLLLFLYIRRRRSL